MAILAYIGIYYIRNVTRCIRVKADIVYQPLEQILLYSQTKGVKRGYTHSLFHTKDLEDNKDNVHLQSLSGVQQCL